MRTRVGPFEVWRFRYLALGLSQSLAEEFVDRPQPLAAALAALMRSAVWDRPEKKLQCLRSIGRAPGLDLRQRFLLARVVNTYVELTADEEKRFAAALEREENEEVREMVVTWEEALAEREAAGRVEAAQRADLRAAEQRFGPLPHAFEERVRETRDLDRLYQILDRILEAKSIEEIDLD